MSVQQTIQKPVSCEGIGLHTGRPARLTLRPAPDGFGIVFQRSDLGREALVQATPENVADVNYSTTLAKDGVEVRTVEHLMAALAGLGVDNLLVELEGVEVPAMDGSAAPFVELIRKAGLKKQQTPRSPLQIKKPINISLENRGIRLVPSRTLKVIYTMTFDHPLLGEQTVALPITAESFVKEIAPARTFGFLKDVQHLRELGLARGGSLRNAVVIGEAGPINGPLRYRDELVRHKILDLVGDLYLLGRPVVGTVIAYGAGHLLHAKLVNEIQRQLQEEQDRSGVEHRAASLLPPSEPLRPLPLPR
ncbi:MAG: UDP-3-O-acyl-N-acetylglucosamine deacetylase [candidate division NC10 bacterium]|nr:UDP-3-O-acyl-N-acetylglucosamine deacetylase [candidate division NC10 bacterium]